MKAIVLGSNSFAGSIFVDDLVSQGNNVIGINRSDQSSAAFHPVLSNKLKQNYKFFKLDLNKHSSEIIEIILDERPEFIIDFAGQGMVAESWLNPDQWYLTNIVSKAKLYKQLQNTKFLEKYIRISTPEVYGSHLDLITESAMMNPSTPYAISHMATDLSLLNYFKNFNFPVVLGRFANFYGPHQQLYRIIPKTILCILKGEKLQLHGGGHSIRAFIHGRDVSEAISSLLSKGALGEVYHFSTNEFISIRDVVNTICKQLKYNFDDLVEDSNDRIGKDQAYLMDSSKAKKQLEWAPRISFDKGVSDTIKWVEDNLAILSKQNSRYLHKE